MRDFDEFVVVAAASDRAECRAPAQAGGLPYSTQEADS